MTHTVITEPTEELTAELLDAKTPSEVDLFECSFEVPNYWQPDTRYEVNNVVRPPLANGFEYVVTTAGQSGGLVPRFVATNAASVSDGSVVWQARPVTSASLVRVLVGTPVVSATGVTISGNSLVGQALRFLIAGGSDGSDYLVSVTGTYDDGVVDVQHALLPVREPV